MNEVYLEGIITDIEEPQHTVNTQRHLKIRLKVSHVTTQKKTKSEKYTINAWNKLATWGLNNLELGMKILVKGYLTQQSYSNILFTEITASKFIIGSAIKTMVLSLPQPLNHEPNK